MIIVKNKQRALQEVFRRRPKQLNLLLLHRDEVHCCEDKAAATGKGRQHMKNLQSTVIKMLGVKTMSEAVEAAIHYQIIEPKPKPALTYTNQWSEPLRHFHRKHIDTLSRRQKKQLGIEGD
ncbi:MAG TPA: hypothetical protein VF411_02995 [Bacteroidia bacterium]